MKAVFFGSSVYCLPLIKSLSTHFQLEAIISKKDSAVAGFTAGKSRLFEPLNKAELLSLKEEIKRIGVDFFLVADYGIIIPPEIFSLPRYGTINIHFSKLPEFRGASPVQYTLLSGAGQAWITYQTMAGKMDTGNIIHQQKISLQGHEKTAELYSTLFEKAAEILPEIINGFISGEIKPIKQDEAKTTYTNILQRNDGFVPWSMFLAALSAKNALQHSLSADSAIRFALTRASSLAQALERSVRALYPWPGVWTIIGIMNNESGIMNEKRLKIITAKLVHNKFVPEIVQLEGKRAVSWKQFLEGYGESLPSTSSMALKSSLK